jgi:endogenous inhibitor of DNA gyrase (YacG/DUF329 family)
VTAGSEDWLVVPCPRCGAELPVRRGLEPRVTTIEWEAHCPRCGTISIIPTNTPLRRATPKE